ncbi:hypothetical protein, partial [Falsiroseomonas sp. E2-1-a20]|uniref:hypothetical protein n=1 Tax=Falsiroseomonas sp. E2-1-a20 TaxID=3239300 RepID=UPI003F402A23
RERIAASADGTGPVAAAGRRHPVNSNLAMRAFLNPGPTDGPGRRAEDTRDQWQAISCAMCGWPFGAPGTTPVGPPAQGRISERAPSRSVRRFARGLARAGAVAAVLAVGGTVFARDVAPATRASDTAVQVSTAGSIPFDGIALIDGR